jgi:hypothetical protein
MPLYRYSLESDFPDIYSKCKLPAYNLLVSYKDVGTCTTSIDSDGIVGIELPDELIRKIQTGEAKIVHWNQELPDKYVGEDGKRYQLSSIEVMDLF